MYYDFLICDAMFFCDITSIFDSFYPFILFLSQQEDNTFKRVRRWK